MMSSYAELYAAWYHWRPTQAPKKAKSDNGVTALLRAAPFKATPAKTKSQFNRIVKRTPQVMVKVTKPVIGRSHAIASMSYISRNNEVAMIDETGNGVHDIEAIRAMATEWSEDAVGDANIKPKANVIARRIQFSMPAGTDPEALRGAVAATARTVFPDHRYVYAMHTDRPHPHIHMMVENVSEAGVRLRIGKQDLLAMRMTLAMELRQRGIEADATPQIARGARVLRPTAYAIGDQIKPRTGAPDADVARVYGDAAKRLRASGGSDDIKLAAEIDQLLATSFTRSQPVAERARVTSTLAPAPGNSKPKV